MLAASKRLLLSITTMLLLSTQVFADSAILSLKIEGDFEVNYQSVYQQLEQQRFYVVFEPNIGRSVARNAERWGDEYNKNNFSDLRSLVFCNPWYVNQISNQDPDMLALCPLSVTLVQKDNDTLVKFVRPSALKPDSPALALLRELESDIVKALKAAGAE